MLRANRAPSLAILVARLDRFPKEIARQGLPGRPELLVILPERIPGGAETAEPGDRAYGLGTIVIWLHDDETDELPPLTTPMIRSAMC